MANSLLTISMITKESLMQLKNQLVFAKSINRQYDDKFAVEGAKIGSVINIRKPQRYEVTDGPILNIQDTTDQSVALTLDKQKHVGMQFSSKDMALSLDEFSERIIQPAVVALANQVDLDALALYKNVANAAGTPGVTPATLAPYLAAKRLLAQSGAPKGMKNLVIDPTAEAVIVNALSGLFQSSEQIKMQYEEGMMGIAAGFKWKMAQNVAIHTVGAYGGVPLVNGVTVSGASSIVTDGWTASVVGLLKQGDIITFAGVFAVNPQTRQTTGFLKQFVVTADVNSDAGGNATIPISPSIISVGNGPFANVTALPANNAVITVLGAASAVSPSNLAYHKDAFALATADLPVPEGVDKGGRASDPDSGLSIRLVRDYDIVNDRFPCRLDILYGVQTIYPELACRVQG